MRIPRASWHTLAHALFATATLFSAGCDSAGGASHRTDNGSSKGTAGDGIWNADSSAIDFELTGAVGQEICKFSATRDELTEQQLQGLSALKLKNAAVRAGCDVPSYTITVHAKDGSSQRYSATSPDCSSGPIVLFGDFDAWASGTPCSGRCLDATKCDAGGTSDAGDASDAAARAADMPGVRWARSVVSADSASTFDAVVADDSGNVYVAGNLIGPASFDFGNGVEPKAASNGYDGMLIKYDRSGTAQWAKIVEAGTTRTGFNAIAVDTSGDIYVAGDVYGSPGPVDFGNGVTITTSVEGMSAVLVKYDSSGRAQWAQTADGPDDSSFNSLAIDSKGNVYVAAGVDGTGTYDFGHGVTAKGAAKAVDGFTNMPATAVLLKYDPSGAAQWAVVVSGSPASGFTSVAVDSSDNLYAAGGVAGPDVYDFGNGVTVTGSNVKAGGGPFTGEAGGDSFLVKYDASGMAQWARTSGGAGFSSIAVDSSGSAFVVGSIGSGTYNLGHGVSVTASVKNGSFTGTAGPGFVLTAKYDASGTPQWARTVNPGGSSSYLNCVAVDSSGNAYVGGAVHSTGNYDFGDGVVIKTGTEGMGYVLALVKYDANGVAQWAQSSTNAGSSEDQFTSIYVDSAGSLYASGLIAGPGLVDFGDDVTIDAKHQDVYGWNALLVRYQ